MIIRILLFLGILSLSSCFDQPPIDAEGDIIGLRPIYYQGNVKEITSNPPLPFDNLGKIVVQGNFLYINEQNVGIHIIDNTDPLTPISLAFISIPGCIVYTVNGNIIYANNAEDLVAIQVDNDFMIVEIERTEDFYNEFDFASQLYPENFNGVFECVDQTQGTVIGWVETILDQPKCWR